LNRGFIEMDEVGIERRRRERKKADMRGQKRGRK
jgi:hypothetical protein